jgi:cell division protein FtsL
MAITVLAIIGLIINIKTIAINEATQKTNRRIDELREENQGLLLQVLSHTTLENIDHIASTQLGMEPCRTVIYLPTTHAAQ